MVNENDVRTIVLNYQKILQNSERWEFANNILYDMCKKYPCHNDDNIVVAKIWLIGRSYAAAIERRQNAQGYTGDFYYDDVAPIIMNNNIGLDDRIKELNKNNDVEKMLKLHADFTRLLRDITDLNKRSLASKYLHFHCPNAFPIYDSIASTNIKSLVKIRGDLRNTINQALNSNGNLDKEYVYFAYRLMELKQHILINHNLDLSLREMDTILLNVKKLIN